ncbi:hypothetical protein [Mycoplasma procyoni]|uniref:hypothetical protein n=1 Tax=Mycoplasma procyoni TaxID=568784 RepID=UPI00197C4050|nr:hypothetical protein [Mycoplasma procyoni]MBN3534761.1 hypothetical protein [Mycoplasma procyoni]
MKTTKKAFILLFSYSLVLSYSALSSCQQSIKPQNEKEAKIFSKEEDFENKNQIINLNNYNKSKQISQQQKEKNKINTQTYDNANNPQILSEFLVELKENTEISYQEFVDKLFSLFNENNDLNFNDALIKLDQLGFINYYTYQQNINLDLKISLNLDPKRKLVAFSFAIKGKLWHINHYDEIIQTKNDILKFNK